MTSESPTHPDAPRAGGETPETLTVLAERAAYTIERLRAVSESVNAGHDRYIPNDADDAADLIAEMRSALLARHQDGERDTPDTTAILHFRADELRSLRDRAPAELRDDLARIESAIRGVAQHDPDCSCSPRFLCDTAPATYCLCGHGRGQHLANGWCMFASCACQCFAAMLAGPSPERASK